MATPVFETEESTSTVNEASSAPASVPAEATLTQIMLGSLASQALYVVPEGGDAYIMKSIIHDWDDERALKILQNIRQAMRPDGRVLLVEAVITPGNNQDFGKLIDLEMLVSPGGKERTAAEFEELFRRAGLRLTRIVPTKSPFSVIEAVAA